MQALNDGVYTQSAIQQELQGQGRRCGFPFRFLFAGTVSIPEPIWALPHFPRYQVLLQYFWLIITRAPPFDACADGQRVLAAVMFFCDDF